MFQPARLSKQYKVFLATQNLHALVLPVITSAFSLIWPFGARVLLVSALGYLRRNQGPKAHVKAIRSCSFSFVIWRNRLFCIGFVVCIMLTTTTAKRTCVEMAKLLTPLWSAFLSPIMRSKVPDCCTENNAASSEHCVEETILHMA